MNPTAPDPAVALLWISVACLTMAGAVVLARWRAPLALPAGTLLLTVSAELIVQRTLQLWGPLLTPVGRETLLTIPHLAMLGAWFYLVLDLTRACHWRRRTWWAVAIASAAIGVAAGLGASLTATVAASWPNVSTPAWLVALSAGVGTLTGIRLLAASLKTGPRRPLSVAALACLTLAGLAGMLQRGGIAAGSPLSLTQWIYIAIGLIAALGVARGQPNRTISSAQTLVYEHIRDGVIVLGFGNDILSLNTAAREILGCGTEPAVHTPLRDVWPEGEALLHNAEATAGGIDIVIQRDGVALTYAVAVLPTENLSGAGAGHVVVLRDVTGREDLEHILRKRAQELSRTNQLVTALASVTARLGSTRNPRQVWETLGSELGTLGLSCSIVSKNPTGDSATIRYVSLNAKLLTAIARVTGIHLQNYVVPQEHWPEDHAMLAGSPLWYPSIKTFVRRTFPQVPTLLLEQALKLAGIGDQGRLCMLPLVVEKDIIGALFIWGPDLLQDDSPVLEVFAGQVAGILSSADAHAQEIVRNTDLERSNAMILAMSKVAARLDSTTKFEEVIDTFGQELHTMGFECLVGTFDETKQNMRLQYISVNRDVIQWAERVTGFSLSYLLVPRRLWPSDKVVTDRAPYWDPRGMAGALNIFPVLNEGIHRSALQLTGVNLNDPVCYLPLAHDEDIIGILAVWGTGLQPGDVPALSVFSTQLATAIRNTELFENEARRTRELSVLLEASQATAASSDLDQVLSTLATQLLEISGFEACQISEWDSAGNRVNTRHHRSRIAWERHRQGTVALNDDPEIRAVLETGVAAACRRHDGDTDRDLIRLPLRVDGRVIGLAEVTLPVRHGRDPADLVVRGTAVLAEGSGRLAAPLAATPAQGLLAVQDALLRATGGGECRLLQGDRADLTLKIVATASDVAYGIGTGPSREPVPGDAVALAIHAGEASTVVEPMLLDQPAEALDGEEGMQPRSLVVFPLQVGPDRIGVVELSDFNHERTVSPAQVAFLRTVADKAGYSIDNARLLEETQRRLGEKEVLLKEVHHRVKNNLQVISSLLSLQSARISDAGVKDALRESQNRVRSMALIHEKLYQSSDLAQVDFAGYLRSLVNFLAQSYRQQADHVALDVQATSVRLDLETAIPCGLIVNELVSNSLKHAFPDGRSGVVAVSLQPDEIGRWCLRVSDDGVGYVATPHTSRSSLGLSLVETLTAQLGGTITVSTEQGVTTSICFNAAGIRSTREPRAAQPAPPRAVPEAANLSPQI